MVPSGEICGVVGSGLPNNTLRGMRADSAEGNVASESSSIARTRDGRSRCIEAPPWGDEILLIWRDWKQGRCWSPSELSGKPDTYSATGAGTQPLSTGRVRQVGPPLPLIQSSLPGKVLTS